jgi:hypothetical protein
MISPKNLIGFCGMARMVSLQRPKLLGEIFVSQRQKVAWG